MKKAICIILVTLMFAFTLTGCSNNTAESLVLEATVMSCEEGTYHKNSSYSNTANMYLAQGDYLNYNLYSSIANTTGYYDYNITVDIGGEYQIIVRDKTYEVGSKIYVTKVMTYNESNELIDIDYR